METISIEQLIDYSQDLEIEDVDFYDGLILSYDSSMLFDTRDIEEDIEWKKDNGHDYEALEVLYKYMEKREIEECYISE